MTAPLLEYLTSRSDSANPAKGSLPDKQKWVDFREFDLQGSRLCICDSWGPHDGAMIPLQPGKYVIKALCYDYGGDVRVAALRIEREGSHGELGEPVGEFSVDVGAVGVLDIDRIDTLRDDAFGEWIESYSYADGHPPAGIHPCPEARTEMLFTESGWGDGWYKVYGIVQDGQLVGAEARFIEENEPYPFPYDRTYAQPQKAPSEPQVEEGRTDIEIASDENTEIVGKIYAAVEEFATKGQPVRVSMARIYHVKHMLRLVDLGYSFRYFFELATVKQIARTPAALKEVGLPDVASLAEEAMKVAFPRGLPATDAEQDKSVKWSREQIEAMRSFYKRLEPLLGRTVNVLGDHARSSGVWPLPAE